MIISILNHTGGKIADDEVQRVLRAVNRQIGGDFASYWGLGATLRLEGRSETRPSKTALVDMRGDAVLYLWDRTDAQDAVGYHDLNHRGIPYGFVFTELSGKIDPAWSVTLSHEALELIADPDANLLAMGPHPKDLGRDVFHWYEMCDAVQDETYEIDGVAVSNFVLPLYFTGGNERGGRNDFLGRSHNGRTLPSFGVNPGGYVGFFDPKYNKMDDFDADEKAARRRALKSQVGSARRGIRYGRFHTGRARPQPVLGPIPAAAARRR